MIYGSWICLLSPLAAAGLITLAGGRITRRGAGYLATLSCFVSFGGAVAAFVSLLGRDAEQRSVLSTAWIWITGGTYRSGLAVLIDPLSVMMMLIVSGVGALIVLYSIGYMDGDREERRYFAYMALFVFSMLLLVQGGNLLILLAGWGMVGLSSYLLIGFWHERPSAIAAAKKAFVMNAIGDATMALALFLLIQKAGSVDFGILGGQYTSTVANLVALGLLGGAVAKSAQLPLQTWLPDAMEGPTPVSALIHAATMVTAGVYLIVRTHAIFESGAEGRRPRRRPRRGDAARRRPGRARAGRHQTRDRVLDHVADRLHVPRGRARRVRERDVPSDDARLLQGAALHGGRHRHPRAHRRTGHPQDGRLTQVAAANVHRVRDRLGGSGRATAVRRLLLEGLDPRRRDGPRGLRLRPLGRRSRGDVPDRALHVQAPLPRVLG